MKPGTPSASIDNARLFAILEQSDLVRQAKQDEAARVVAEREKLAATLADLKAEQAREFQDGPTRLAAIQARRLDIERQLLEVVREQARIAAGVHGASHLLNRRVEAAESELREGASPAIAEFVSWTVDEFFALRKVTPQSHVTVRENRYTGEKTPTVEASNVPSINARLQALLAARVTAEEMALEPDQTTIPAKLDRLKAGIPKVEMRPPDAPAPMSETPSKEEPRPSIFGRRKKEKPE